MCNRIELDKSWHSFSAKVKENVIEYKNTNKLTLDGFVTKLNCTSDVANGILFGDVNFTYRAVEALEQKLDFDMSNIKSHIKKSHILFDYSQTSGFVYKIVGCDERGMHKLNANDSLVDIVASIRSNYSLEYVGCRNEIFEQNIKMVDSRMDEILQYALLLRVGYLQNDSSTMVASTCQVLAEKNPLNVRNPQAFYTSKLKSFLFASFAGMTASEEWSGRKLLTGGYIDVDKDGDMLYYRAISDDVFENYLYQHTYFDRPDRGELKEVAVEEGKCFLEKNRLLTEEEKNNIITGCHGKKGDFGYVYQEGDGFYIAINFQIRFR